MRLGIDLGTTRTVVVASDRGNYPVIGFAGGDGDMLDFVPTVSAEQNGQLLHGHAAEEAARRGAPYLRSWKRLMGRHGPEHPVRIGRCEITLLELSRRFLVALLASLRDDSNLPAQLGEAPEVVISVPANAHSAQRFTTLEAFRAAGFNVRAMLNESSAAGIEYAHRFRRSLNTKRDHVAVYDLGGGTFDAALVTLAGSHHDVVRTAGIRELGGDDVDAALLDLALATLGLEAAALDEPTRLGLLDECRAAKEGIGAHTKRVVLELSKLGDAAPSEPVLVPVEELYERVRPLIDQSLRALADVMVEERPDDGMPLRELASQARVAGVYVVGGASGLPIVARQLREHLDRRVHRSPYPSASIAIGLAIAGDDEQHASLTERLSRHLGVFRERDGGANIAFDSIFASGIEMPANQHEPLIATRRYQAAHNVGVFRFIECGAVRDGQPSGDISPHDTVYFPFAAALRNTALHAVGIERLDAAGPVIEERYQLDASGVVSVTIRDQRDGFERQYLL